MPAGSVKGGGALACHAEGVTSEVRTERRGGDTLENPGGSTFRAEAEALGAAGGPRAGSEEQARRPAWRSHRASRAQPRRCLPPEMQEIQAGTRDSLFSLCVHVLPSSPLPWF